MQEADVVFLVLDSSRPLESHDYELLEETKSKKRIILYNKVDLTKSFEKTEEMIALSTQNKQGFLELEERIEQLVKINDFDVMDANYLSNIRHITLMKKAVSSLENAIISCKDIMDSSFIEIDLKECFDTLGEITGEAYDDELIDSLFSKFCLGK